MNRPRSAPIEQTVRMSDHDVIYPKNELRLRALVRTSATATIDEAAVERAGAALSALASDFDGWMNEEVEKLIRAHQAYLRAPTDPANQVDLFRQAHDLRGNAAMLGYPLVGEAAHSLARLLDALPPLNVPIGLVETHVQSIRALASRAIHGAGNATAFELVSELRNRTNPVIDAYQRAEDPPER